MQPHHAALRASAAPSRASPLPGMSVLENVMTGRNPKRRSDLRAGPAPARARGRGAERSDKAEEVMQFLRPPGAS
jgi:hypothetical protein